MRRAVLLALLLVGTALTGCTGAEQTSDEPLAWSFTDTEGQDHSDETAAGSPTVFFFMATWCSSCQAMTDDMRQVHADHSADGVDVYSLSWDPQEDEEDLAAWKAEYNQSWPHGNDPDLDVAETFGVESQSSVVLLDGDNKKARHWGYGEATASDVSAAVDGLESS